MNQRNSTSKVNFAERSVRPSQNAMGLNILAVIFLMAGLMAVAWAVREQVTAVPASIEEMPQSASVPQNSPSVADHPWTPFGSYAPIFASKDIFKTDEERILEATQLAKLSANVPVGDWGIGYQLVGVIVDADPRAIVRTLDPLSVQTLAIGDRLGDATLVKVEENMALFESQNKRMELRFVKEPPK